MEVCYRAMSRLYVISSQPITSNIGSIKIFFAPRRMYQCGSKSGLTRKGILRGQNQKTILFTLSCYVDFWSCSLNFVIVIPLQLLKNHSFDGIYILNYTLLQFNAQRRMVSASLKVIFTLVRYDRGGLISESFSF